MNNLKRSGRWFLLVVVLILLVDQITKYFLKGVNFGIFRYVTNTGAAFGLFKGWGFILSIIAIIVLVLVVYFYRKYPKLWLPLSFIFAGTLGNLLDRIIFGFVRDFIDFKIWPVFNVADSFNVIGVVILIWILIKKEKLS